MRHAAAPELLDSHQHLIQAAAEAFREEGYRASIDRIAARAGMARQTVYNHFSSKEDLFSEVAHLAARDILVSLDGEGQDLRTRLINFGATLRQRVIGDEGVAMLRTLSAEAARFPELARAFMEKDPEQAARCLAEFLAQAMDSGLLRRDDPRFAAEMLISMLDGFDRTRRLLGAAMFTPEQENARVTRIVDCFLHAYVP